LAAVKQLYRWIDRSIQAAGAVCANCGKCCDFDRFGHRLFVTTVEMVYFEQGLRTELSGDGAAFSRPANGRCPYHQNGLCLGREFRPTGCRIFFCNGLAKQYQNELAEQVLERLRRLHEQFGAVYYYADLRDWLYRSHRTPG